MELAGDRIRIEETADGKTTITFDDKGTGRVCGDCQLCCKLVPVPTIDKPANTRCQHQRHGKGCLVYAGRPFACRTWACRWLADPGATGLPRPDRAHYVIDVSWDFVTLTHTETGEPQHIPVIQVWVDPAFRNAYRAPELRAYMAMMAERYGAATLVRFGPGDALTVFAPHFSGNGTSCLARSTSVAKPKEGPPWAWAYRAPCWSYRISTMSCCCPGNGTYRLSPELRR